MKKTQIILLILVIAGIVGMSFFIKDLTTQETFATAQKKNGKKLAAYGAAAKGNTLLNYCGVKNDIIDFVVDANPHKQNKWLPGSHIPVVHEEYLKKIMPDYVIVLPWNLTNEITDQLAYIRKWGARFVVPIPRLQLL